MRQELQSVLTQARTLAPEELPRLLGDLEEIRATALARLTGPAAENRPDELLSVDETAKRMGVSACYLYHHHKRLPFARKVGRKLLFSSAGLDSYLKRAR
jgi:excisionase family DNA binding protein